jgi:hypothetical protein
MASTVGTLVPVRTTTTDHQALSWLNAQLRWERLLEELRQAADQPEAPLAAVEHPRAA